MLKMPWIISVVLSVFLITCFSLSTYADPDMTPDSNAPANTQYEVIWVSAGGYADSSPSIKTDSSSSFYVRLRWFKFSNLPQNYMPAGKGIRVKLCEAETGNQLGDVIVFSGITSPGCYNYYTAGLGTIGQSYFLRIRSSVTTLDLEAIFDWSPNSY